MWKAGHCLIKAKMKEDARPARRRDERPHLLQAPLLRLRRRGVRSARLLEILTHEKRPLSALLADVPRTFASPEIRVDVPEEKKFDMVRRATEVLRAAGHSIIDVDGVRVTFADGWGLIRACNTQPLLVLRFEAKTEGRLREIQSLIENTVRQVQREVGA